MSVRSMAKPRSCLGLDLRSLGLLRSLLHPNLRYANGTTALLGHSFIGWAKREKRPLLARVRKAGESSIGNGG